MTSARLYCESHPPLAAVVTHLLPACPNQVKFTPEGGSVTMSVDFLDPEWTLRVRVVDTGTRQRPTGLYHGCGSLRCCSPADARSCDTSLCVVRVPPHLSVFSYAPGAKRT